MLPILHILCFATGSVFAKVQFAGMNIAGLEFGCDMNVRTHQGMQIE